MITIPFIFFGIVILGVILAIAIRSLRGMSWTPTQPSSRTYYDPDPYDTSPDPTGFLAGLAVAEVFSHTGQDVVYDSGDQTYSNDSNSYDSGSFDSDSAFDSGSSDGGGDTGDW